jgi:alpha-tubulin suppressor-like RCC1 family protein
MRSSNLAILCLAVLLLPVTSCGDSTGPAAPARLVFSVQPGAATAGAAFAASPQVTAQDASGNVVSSSTLSITIALASGTTGANLRGTRTVSAVNGVAVFNGLSIDSVGLGYVLTVSANGVPAASSASFGVTAAPAQVLAFTAQPSNVVAATAISPAVQVVIRDSVGNTVTTATTSITLAITSGTGTSGAALGGTLAQTAVGGVATFSALAVDKSGTGYALTGRASGLTSATSTTFAVSAGAAARLGFVVQPSAAYPAGVIAPPVQVAVRDSFGNLATSSAATVTLTISSGTGAVGAVLGGTLTVAAVSGLASFGDLTVDGAGIGYTLTATSGVLSPATSQSFYVAKLIARDLSAGWNHTCAASVAGAAYCWGSNGSGQLGDGTDSNRFTPVAVAGGLVFQSISAGLSHTCGVTTSGAAYCWGFNDGGQLGDGTFGSRTSPVAVSGGLVFQAISAGSYRHTCGLTTGGAAYCWGENDDGQLGGSPAGSHRNSPALVSGSLVFQAISAGFQYACGLTTSGAAYCWGNNYLGRLGDGTDSSRFTPVAVAGGLVFQSISAGYYHTCGVTTSGAAYCWGNNLDGQLGGVTHPATFSSTPVAVSGGLVFQAISASAGFYSHTCGLTTGRAAYCWGDNDYGQLGNGTSGFYANRSIGAVLGGLVFESINAGELHTCGLTSTGAAYCWGDSRNGQLGNRWTTPNRLSPVAVIGF